MGRFLPGATLSGPQTRDSPQLHDREGGPCLEPPRNQGPPCPNTRAPGCPAATAGEAFLCHAFRALSGPHGLQLIIDLGQVCRRPPVGVGRGHIAWGACPCHPHSTLQCWTHSQSLSAHQGQPGAAIFSPLPPTGLRALSSHRGQQSGRAVGSVTPRLPSMRRKIGIQFRGAWKGANGNGVQEVPRSWGTHYG